MWFVDFTKLLFALSSLAHSLKRVRSIPEHSAQISRSAAQISTSAAQISTSAAQISTLSDDGGEPCDSVSIAGREGGKVNQAANDSTAEDTGAALVEVDAAVGMLDVDNTGIEAVEPTAKNKPPQTPLFLRHCL